MHKLFALMFLALSAMLNGELVDHFKKAPNKSDIHKFRNIDFIYMINLDQRPEKYEKSLRQLEPYGIIPYRFSAVNGWELTCDDINDVGFKFQPGMQEGILGTTYYPDNNLQPTHEIITDNGQAYFCHCMAKGTIGICLSHLSVLQDAYDSGFDLIWVMEDDIEVLQDPRIIPNLINDLDKAVGFRNWDILFTDRDIRDNEGKYVPCSVVDNRRPDFYTFPHNNYTIRKSIGSKFLRVGGRFGATSMIVTRRGMEKLLTFCKQHKIYFPYDIEFMMPPGIRLYSLKHSVVSNLTKPITDNGSPNYKNKD